MAALEGALLAQGAFRSGGEEFGSGDREQGFVPAEPSTRTPYFLHDQGMKLALLLAFSGAGVVLLVLGWRRLRPLVLLASVGVLGFWAGGFLCPIASVQNVFLKSDTAYLLLFLVPVALALLAGRLFCGAICPFGALQELLHVQRWAVRIPSRWMRVLGVAKYAVLVVLVAHVLVVHTVLLGDWTPFRAFFTLGGTTGTLAISALFAVLSVIAFRPFCRLLCPLGALLSLASRASLLRVRAPTCSGCGACDSSCPVEAMRSGTTDVASCLLCGECARTCPESRLRLRLAWPWRAGRRSVLPE
jgi:polyferredoxin